MAACKKAIIEADSELISSPSAEQCELLTAEKCVSIDFSSIFLKSTLKNCIQLRVRKRTHLCVCVPSRGDEFP